MKIGLRATGRRGANGQQDVKQGQCGGGPHESDWRAGWRCDEDERCLRGKQCRCGCTFVQALHHFVLKVAWQSYSDTFHILYVVLVLK